RQPNAPRRPNTPAVARAAETQSQPIASRTSPVERQAPVAPIPVAVLPQPAQPPPQSAAQQTAAMVTARTAEARTVGSDADSDTAAAREKEIAAAKEAKRIQ